MIENNLKEREVNALEIVRDEDDLREKLQKGIAASENGEACSVEEAFNKF